MTTRPITLTLTQLRKLKPCHLERHELLFKAKPYMTVRQALEAGVSIPDLLWVAGKLDLKSQIVSFAARVARKVAHLNPDPRVMAAIEAAEAWVHEPSECNTEAAANAADAARAAANAGLSKQRIREIFAEIFDPQEPSA